MDLRGWLEMMIRVDANGNPSVINGVHMIVCRMSGCFASIWVVPQKYIMAFVPIGDGGHFFMQKGREKTDRAGTGISG